MTLKDSVCSTRILIPHVSTSSTSTRTSISDLSLGNNQDDKITQLSTLLEALGEGQDSSPGVTIRNQDETPPMLEEQVQLDLKKWFGLARMNNRTQNSSDHFIIGTFGYVAPEYTKRGKSTTQTDVYAFGVVLLELVTGRSPTDTRLKGQSLLKWAIPLIQDKKYSELIDPGISYQDNQLTSIVQIAVECLCANAHTRLSMEDVMHKLDYIKDENISHEDQCANEIEEVNETVENICQSQRHFDENVNFSYGAMTPLPKQAKHFYQVAQT
ncbi:receptor-like serine/threonine-protein kinase [Tanacetum coccineum]